MKTYRILALIGLTALMAVSCFNQEYDYEKKVKIDTPANFTISVDSMEDTVVLMSPRTKSYTVKVTASSVADDLLTLTIGSDPSKVAAYNRSHGTSFEAVPGDAFSLTKDQLLLPRYNKVSSTTILTLNSAAMPDDNTARILPLTITKIEGSSPTSLSQTDSTFFILFRRKGLPASGFELGTGTEADPYIIRNQTELACVPRAMKSGQKTYFKMDADVDMKGYEDWIPANAASPYDMAIDFDGAGHKISNFYCNADAWPSFVGCLVGSVRDVTFDNPVLDVSGTPAGLLGARAGTSEGAEAEVRNVTVNGMKINVIGTSEGVGGLIGTAYNTTFANVKVETDILDADEDSKVPSSIAGVAGVVYGGCFFTGCETKGSLHANQRGGGIIGYIRDTAEDIKVEKCSSSMTIVTESQNAGGLIGLAYAPKLTVTDSHATGDVTTLASHYAGGLIGSMNGTSTIQRCYATGNITSNGGNHNGGLIGNAARTTGDSLIEDCYATGNVTLKASNGRMAGGLIGVIENKTGITVRRCYASGDIKSEYSVNGGLIAFAKSSTLTDDINFTLEQSIAWNKTITCPTGAPTTWSSGAVIAVSNVYNTLTDNYRRPDMEFADGSEVTPSIFDSPNVSAAAPLKDALKVTYYYPYHGLAAPAGSTISSVAKSLGWPEDVWDLSGDAPKLK